MSVKRRTFKFGTNPATLTAMLSALSAVCLCGCPQNPPLPPQLAVRADDHVLETGDPVVTVIEYANFDCSHCGEFTRDVFPVLRARYVDTGKVRWVFRHLPITPAAGRAAQASECADQQGRFWDYLELVFAHQNALDDAALRGYAEQLGLDLAAFDACVASGAEAERVDEDTASALLLGVNSTPTFFIGAQRIVGAMSLDQFSAELDAALLGR